MTDETAREIFRRLEDHSRALARIEGMLEALPCDRHGALLDGNGNPGLRVRVDRLEQAGKSRRSLWFWLIPVLISVAALLLPLLAR